VCGPSSERAGIVVEMRRFRKAKNVKKRLRLFRNFRFYVNPFADKTLYADPHLLRRE
jgi:hypothetical protein